MAYITTPVYEERDHITCVTGRSTTTKTRILVVSLHATAVTVTVSNAALGYSQAYTSAGGADFTMYARGTPTVCYTGVLEITSGLSAYTRYGWSATDGTYTTTGSFFVEPTDNSPFQFDFATCDNNTNMSNQLSANPWKVPGYWQYIKTRAQAANPPHAGILFVDDLGYVDSKIIDDSADSGLQTTDAPENAADADDYLIAWCCMLGLLGPTVATFNAIESPTNNELYLMWAREENRAWCRKNLNMWVQWGDHEITNDIGWDTAVSGNAWTYGKAAWDVFYGLIQPAMADVITPLDASSKHWAFKIGNVTIATLDGITSATSAAFPVVSAGNSAALTEMTAIYGNNQIDDVLTAINTLAGKYTVLGLGNSIRYLVDRTGSAPYVDFSTSVTESANGAQHPIFDHCLANYQRLFTANNIGTVGGTPPASLMQNPKTNGTQGNLILVHGDYHHSMVLHAEHPAYNSGGVNNEAENFYCIYGATINGSGYFSTTGISTGDTKGYMYIAYDETVTTNFHGTTFETSDEGRWLHVRVSDRNDSTSWEKKFMVNGGNYPFDETWDVKVMKGVTE